MSKLTLKQKIRGALYGTGIGMTDEQLAAMLNTSAGAVRGTLSMLRNDDGFTVVKRLVMEDNKVTKAKYFMPAGVAEDVYTRLGRPSHLMVK
jgi:transcription initiation factor IIE alpha subunit